MPRIDSNLFQATLQTPNGWHFRPNVQHAISVPECAAHNPNPNWTFGQIFPSRQTDFCFHNSNDAPKKYYFEHSNQFKKKTLKQRLKLSEKLYPKSLYSVNYYYAKSISSICCRFAAYRASNQNYLTTWPKVFVFLSYRLLRFIVYNLLHNKSASDAQQIHNKSDQWSASITGYSNRRLWIRIRWMYWGCTRVHVYKITRQYTRIWRQ